MRAAPRTWRKAPSGRRHRHAEDRPRRGRTRPSPPRRSARRRAAAKISPPAMAWPGSAATTGRAEDEDLPHELAVRRDEVLHRRRGPRATGAAGPSPPRRSREAPRRERSPRASRARAERRGELRDELGRERVGLRAVEREDRDLVAAFLDANEAHARPPLRADCARRRASAVHARRRAVSSGWNVAATTLPWRTSTGSPAVASRGPRRPARPPDPRRADEDGRQRSPERRRVDRRRRTSPSCRP